jgi:hypothetical protein
MKRLHLKHQGQLPIKFNDDPHSKALESVCLFHSPIRPLPHSLGIGGELHDFICDFNKRLGSV